ncbi:hypothetical protein ACFPYI_17240 [Halomarina salina]|uniref:DUF7350 domain-containing protein n=1 Tax=Halomarina salina TaxID=1872699 RepID=A0ABD5RSG6_9EURY|nr:fe2+ transport protein [Halomarina salina]
MQRRRFLAGGLGLAGSAVLAGCSDSSSADPSTDASTTADQSSNSTTGTATPPGTPGEKPSGIYVQSFVETMSMQGTKTAGDYAFALMFTVPHTFWNVNGTEVQETAKTPEDSLHLMAQVWDPETGTVLPETGLSVEIRRASGGSAGELVSQEVIYPMLSQPMGFHYGGNFTLPENGTYSVALSVGGTNIRRTGAFQGRFGDPATVEIPLDFTNETQSEVTTREVEQAGQQGALAPNDMGSLPTARAPAPEDLPGTVRGRTRSDDAVFVVTTLDSPPAGVSGDGYLAVSARTRYNDLLLPAMGLDATVTRGDETVFDGSLTRTLDPDLNYHYGTSVDVESGDSLTLTPTAPPQVARHEGYETAFLQFEPTTLDL